MKSAHLLPSLLVVATLAACNGGGGSGEPQSGTNLNPGAANNTPTEQIKLPSATRYDAFFDGTTLNLVDRNATVPTALALSNFGSVGQTPQRWQFYTGTLTSNGITKISSNYLLYVNAGHFYRVELNSVGLPTPTQISNEAEANLICDAHKYQSINSGIAGLSYSLRGADGLCGTGDDTFKRITLAQVPMEPPKAISKQEFESLPLFNAQDWGTGSLSVAQGNIEWRDNDFANPQTLFPGNVVAKLKYLHTSPDNRYTLFAASLLNPGNTSWHLFVFDQQLKTVSPELGQTATYPSYDGSEGYEFVAEYNGDAYLTRNNTDIIKLPINGSSPASGIINNGKGVTIIGDRLVIAELAMSQGGNAYSSILLTDPASTITRLKSGVTMLIPAKDRLFYTQPANSALGTTVTSGSMRADGSDEKIRANVMIAGASLNPDEHVFGEPANNQVNRIFFNSNPSFGSGGSYAGGSLQSIDASTGELVKNLGAVPAGVNNYWVLSADYSGVVLATGQTVDGTGRSLYVIDQVKGSQQFVGTAYNNNDWWTDWVRR